jgi:hypothetical protein
MHDVRRHRVQRTASGYCFEAPGVYLWDEDRDEVERAARELARGNRPARPTRRMLVIPPQEVEPPRQPWHDEPPRPYMPA